MPDRVIFDAKEIRTWTSDRVYRVYVQDRSFYLIRTGGQQIDWTTHVAIHFGLLGALIAAMLKPKALPKVDTAALDATDPRQLLGSHKHNFCFGTADVVDSSLDPPSAFGQHGPHVGRWKIALRDGKKRSFEFQDLEAMDTAVGTLPQLLGPVLQVNVAWDERKNRYVKA